MKAVCPEMTGFLRHETFWANTRGVQEKPGWWVPPNIKYYKAQVAKIMTYWSQGQTGRLWEPVREPRIKETFE